MTKLHIQMAAWSPFGHGSSDIFHHPMLLKLATQHHKSAAQVVLRMADAARHYYIGQIHPYGENEREF